MNASDFATALAAGATIVTPNNRLARHLAARYDEGRRAAGCLTWPAARSLPWTTWLDVLWLDALAATAASPALQAIGESEAAHLWDRVVGDGAIALLDARGAAAHAAHAWRLYHAWRRPDDRLELWTRSGIGDDAAAFARWATRYRAVLSERHLVDHAQLPDWLADVALRVPAWRGMQVLMVGFVDVAPQQQRLLEALRAAGSAIVAVDPPRAAAPVVRRVECATPSGERADPLAWARDRAQSNPTAVIGIVLEDLAARRAEVVAAADDLLCPALAAHIAPDAARPYDLSLGVPVGDVPLVNVALDLIALSGEALPVTEALQVLRSPYLPRAEDAWPQRAQAERLWRDLGVRTVTFADAVSALANVDAPLAGRWADATFPGRGARSPAQWAAQWRAWLETVGWPGERTSGSGEWQAREAWSRLLAAFGALGNVTPKLPRADALAALRAMAGRATFQPEAPPARIRIMGVLEASGLDFDALWLAGFAAERWPPPSQPNPLLPLAWQRERNVPHAKADLELGHARALTAGFAHAAGEVIASHARNADGFERTGSTLFQAWPALARDALPQAISHARAIAAAAPALEVAADGRAPALAGGSAVRGGVAIIESQSNCPFQAFARYRLHADTLPAGSEGLTARERGCLLHAALASFWSTVRDHARLVALDAPALARVVDDAVTKACANIERKRWRGLPAAIIAGEARRHGDILRAWINAHEYPRPPFAVTATEAPTTLLLGGLVFTFRIDRVDALADGGAALIDYKSGRAPSTGQWFAARPAGTQIGLYALAHRMAPAAPPLRAAAYAQLKAGQIEVAGLAADPTAWPGLPGVDGTRRLPVATWPELEAWWTRQLGRLADEFRQGEAAVAPRDANACRHCEQQPLCRVRALDDEAPPAGPVHD
jgi:ATP-dependent helicase/nuclease subunit B